MQIKGRDSIGAYLKQSTASNVEHPTEVRSPESAPAPASFEPGTRSAPTPVAPPPIILGTADRIIAYLKEHGPSASVSIVTDLGLSFDDGVATLASLESFGFVSVDREDGKATVALPQ